MRLTRGQERVLVRAAAAFVDMEGGLLPRPEACGVPERLAGMVERLPRDQQQLLRVGCRVVSALAVLMYGRRFSGLDDDRARKLLRGLARSWLKPLRRLHFVLKMMTQFAYFAGEETWAAVGYDGPWLGRIEVEGAAPPQVGAEERA